MLVNSIILITYITGNIIIHLSQQIRDTNKIGKKDYLTFQSVFKYDSLLTHFSVRVHPLVTRRLFNTAIPSLIKAISTIYLNN